MKKTLTTLAIALLALIASVFPSCQREKKVYSPDKIYIEGTINEPMIGVKLVVFRMEDGEGMPVAEDTLRGKNFCFEFPAEFDESGKYDIIYVNGSIYSTSVSLWTKPGAPVRISADDMNIKTWLVKSDDPRQETQNKIIDETRDLWNEFQPILMERKKSRDQQFDAKLDSLRGIIFHKEIECLKHLPVDDVWLDHLEVLAESSQKYSITNEIWQLYDKRLSDEQKQSYLGRKIYEYLDRTLLISEKSSTKIGDLFDLDGNVHHLEDFRGKPVLLDFWSLSCGPCHQAIPELQEIKEKYGESLTIISINLDTEIHWRAGLKKHNVTWHNFIDPQGAKGLLTKFSDSPAIPHFVFLSPEGKDLKSWKGFSKGSLRKKIEELMK